MADSYSNTFYDVCTGEKLYPSNYIAESCVSKRDTLTIEGEKYRVVSVDSESEYVDPYDEHDVDRDYIQTIELLKIGVLSAHGFFYGAPDLTEVVIPSDIKWIDRDAFDFWRDLSSITVDKDNQIFDSRNNCNAVIETSSNRLIIGCRNTVIPESIQEIGSDAFHHCAAPSSVVIPKGVKIDSFAFADCTGLTSVTISKGVEIGAHAFDNCMDLTSVTISKGIKELYLDAFKDCTSLTSVRFSKRILIKYSALDGVFRNCPCLASLKKKMKRSFLQRVMDVLLGGYYTSDAS